MKSTQITPSTQPGNNRTGLAPHPELLHEMVEGTAEFGPSSLGGVDALARVRIRYVVPVHA